MTATENALVAAVAAQGTTYLRNAASEPHVQDLAHFLVALGARIEGIGTNTMVVHGPATLRGTDYSIGPDHIEVGSLIGLAAVTRSPLRIARAGVEHLRSIRMGFERLGIVCRPRRVGGAQTDNMLRQDALPIGPGHELVASDLSSTEPPVFARRMRADRRSFTRREKVTSSTKRQPPRTMSSR